MYPAVDILMKRIDKKNKLTENNEIREIEMISQSSWGRRSKDGKECRYIEIKDQ